MCQERRAFRDGRDETVDVLVSVRVVREYEYHESHTEWEGHGEPALHQHRNVTSFI